MSLNIEVGPFPNFISKEHKESLLKFFGAIKIIHLKKKMKEYYLIARFSSHEECKFAISNLHQADILGRRLVAVYSKKTVDYIQEENNVESLLNKDESGNQATNLKMTIQNFEAKLTSISAKFDILHPISPLLRYSYPPPSTTTLANISHFLLHVPKFYTQVIHLMNKMNLPCPFGRLIPCANDESEYKYAEDTVKNKNEAVITEKEIHEEITDSDTEIEMDEDVKSLFSVQPKKQKRTKRISSKINKRPRLDQLQQSYNTKSKEQKCIANVNEVFDSIEISKQKSLQLNLPNTTISTSTINEASTAGFGKILPATTTTTKIHERKDFITLEEVELNKISESEYPIVPAFKNYKCGEPSNRLYIKNLAKTVLEQDIKFIFGKYVNWCFPDEVSQFSIKLMKTGRMKGQAFVSFESVKTAETALEEINGYILKDKPMVISYSNKKAS